MKWSKSKNRLLSDPIIKSAGFLSYYSTDIDIDLGMLIQHTLSVLGYNDIESNCSDISESIEEQIHELVKNNNLMTKKSSLLFLTKFGVSKSVSIKDTSFKNLGKVNRPSVDSVSWVVIELSPIGESKLDEGNIDKIIRKFLNLDESYPIFVPKAVYHEDNQTINLHLLDGYIFVKSGLIDTDYFRLEQTPYVTRVLSEMGAGGVRVLSVVQNSVIEEMKGHISCLSVNDLRKGDVVTVIQGMYRGLDVSVMEIMGDKALVKTCGLKAIDIITTLPISSLSNVE